MNNKRLINITFTGFAILTVLLVGFIGFLTATHTKTFAVESDSMSPTLSKGDAAFVRNFNPQELQTGDIVTVKFADNSGVFTHRITKIDAEKSMIYTKGDKNPSEDPMPSEFSLIVGRLWFSLPVIGMISLAIQNKMFLIIMAIIAIVLVCTRKIISIKKKLKDGGSRDVA